MKWCGYGKVTRLFHLIIFYFSQFQPFLCFIVLPFFGGLSIIISVFCECVCVLCDSTGAAAVHPPPEMRSLSQLRLCNILS
jgi:hypothetical protein